MPAPSLKGLRVFCTAARLGSFKAAGEALFVTASAVSHQVRGLESQLGTTLFERRTREIVLTDTGHALLRAVGPLLDRIDAEVAEIVGPASRTRLTISLPAFFATEVLIPKLPDFTAAHPDIDIQLDTSDRRRDRPHGEADLTVLLCPRPPEGVCVRPLFPLLLSPVCGRDFTLPAMPDPVAAIAASPLIVHRPRREAWRSWFATRGLSRVNPAKVIEVESMTGVVRAAEQGLGVALVPPRLAGRWLQAGVLRVLDGVGQPTGDSYFVGWRDDVPLASACQRFADWMAEVLGDAGEPGRPARTA